MRSNYSQSKKKNLAIALKDLKAQLEKKIALDLRVSKEVMHNKK